MANVEASPSIVNSSLDTIESENPKIESIFRPVDEAFAELMQRVAVTVDKDPHDEKFADGKAYVMLTKWTKTSEFLSERAGAYNPHRMIDLSLPENRHYFELAYQHMTTDPYMVRQLLAFDGRPWAATEAGLTAEKSLREVFSFESGREAVDIINCSDLNLSPEETVTITQVIGQANALSGGRLLSRITCITLENNDQFEDGIMGGFRPSTGVVRLNLEWARSVIAGQQQITKRYEPYFPDQVHNPIELGLAHELGHAVDLLFPSEFEDHGLDRKHQRNRPSGFQQYFSRSDSVQQTEVSQAATMPETGIDCPEQPPTDYAQTNPLEDFAETFTIICLNGKTDSLPERKARMAEHIQGLRTQGFVGPEKAEIIKKSKDGHIYEIKGNLREISISLAEASD